MLHLCLGIHIPSLKSPIVKLAIKGVSRKQDLMKEFKGKPRRRAITLPILEFLSNQIALDCHLSLFDKQLYHTIAVTAFHGSFRLGELVSRYATSFDSQFTLLCEDVSSSKIPFPDGSLVGCFSFKIKSPNVDRVGRGDLVEVFEVDSRLDPVSALSHYKDLLLQRGWLVPDKPFFRKDNGSCLTKDHVNRFLRDKFSSLLSPDEVLSCHSFRAGVSSHMQAWGFSEEQIKGHGRWSSDAWKSYCKIPLIKRRLIASKLSSHFTN